MSHDYCARPNGLPHVNQKNDTCRSGSNHQMRDSKVSAEAEKKVYSHTSASQANTYGITVGFFASVACWHTSLTSHHHRTASCTQNAMHD
eukprot:4884725-Amphidinium_carterae.1